MSVDEKKQLVLQFNENIKQGDAKKAMDSLKKIILNNIRVKVADS